MSNVSRPQMRTPQMKAYLAKQSEAARTLEKFWEPCVITQTPLESNALIDGQAFTNRVNWAILEIKSRTTMTYEQLMAFPEQDALFTASKIKAGIEAIRILRVPYVAVLYLPRSRMIFWWAVADANGDRLLEMREGVEDVFQPMTGKRELEKVIYLKMDDAHSIIKRPDWAPLPPAD
jgi:hypothetical protein